MTLLYVLGYAEIHNTSVENGGKGKAVEIQKFKKMPDNNNQHRTAKPGDDSPIILKLGNDNKVQSTRSLCMAGGIIYSLNNDNKLIQYVLSATTNNGDRTQYVAKVKDLDLDDRRIEQLYIDPVYENIYLLTRSVIFNITQQHVIRWRAAENEEISSPEENDIFLVDFIGFGGDTEEIVEQLSSTDAHGFLLTSMKRIWVIHGWHTVRY